MDSKIENYGHVPFRGFHAIIIGWIILMFVFVDFIANKLSFMPNLLKLFIYLLPLIIVIYYDVKYSTFSIKNILFFANALFNENTNNKIRNFNILLINNLF